jgi:hypothetical protein
VSDNPGLNEAVRDWIAQVKFAPYLVNGVPVQVVSTLTLPFKTMRPAGVENFDSARNYFEHGRNPGFLAAKGGHAYQLHAEFDAKGRDGKIETGSYEDTWVNETQWRREARFGKSNYVRTRDGDKTYVQEEGQDVGLLRLVLRLIEPIPSMDTFVESDWRMTRESIGDTSFVRVASGYESPTTGLAAQSRAYWFDPFGRLVKTHVAGVETQLSGFEDFDGRQVARLLQVRVGPAPALQVRVIKIEPATSVSNSNFRLGGTPSASSFTDEVR